MVVRVLDGPDPDLIKRVSCRSCASRLEYVNADVKSHHGRDYSGGADGYEYVSCPKCHCNVIIRSW